MRNHAFLGRVLSASILSLVGFSQVASADGPALAGHLDLAQVAAALARLTPLDALSGPWPAGAYAAHLVYGPLLRNAGPLTLTGDPLPSSKDAAQVELRLPLR